MDVDVSFHSSPRTFKWSLHVFAPFSWTPSTAFVAGTAGAGGGAITASPSGKAFNHLTMRHFTVHWWENPHVEWEHSPHLFFPFFPKCVPKMKAHGLPLKWRQCLGLSGWSKSQSWFQHIPTKCYVNILRSRLFRAALQRFCKTSTSLAVFLDSEIAYGTIQCHPINGLPSQSGAVATETVEVSSCIIRLHGPTVPNRFLASRICSALCICSCCSRRFSEEIWRCCSASPRCLRCSCRDMEKWKRVGRWIYYGIALEKPWLMMINNDDIMIDNGW